MDLSGREHRLLDLSKVRDNRYKGSGIHVNEDKRARCTAEVSEWISEANTARGGTTPFPYGLYLFEGSHADLPQSSAELGKGPFLEMIPCDRPDRRAANLTWNEAGTEAEFSFAALATLLGIDLPKGTTLWIEAIPAKDKEGKPVMLLPVGDRIKTQSVRDTAASQQKDPPASP